VLRRHGTRSAALLKLRRARAEASLRWCSKRRWVCAGVGGVRGRAQWADGSPLACQPEACATTRPAPPLVRLQLRWLGGCVLLVFARCGGPQLARQQGALPCPAVPNCLLACSWWHTNMNPGPAQGAQQGYGLGLGLG